MPEPGTLRLTPQRRVILEELRRFKEHPTAKAVFDRVRGRLPRISLGTVYRNLEVLSRRGMLRTLELGCAERRYDGDIDDHYHLCCIRCGRIEDAPMAPLAGLEEALDATGYALIGHRLEFKGICPGCQAARKDAGGGGRRESEEETARR